MSIKSIPLEHHFYTVKLGFTGVYLFLFLFVCLFEAMLNAPVNCGDAASILWDLYSKLERYDMQKKCFEYYHQTKPTRLVCMDSLT